MFLWLICSFVNLFSYTDLSEWQHDVTTVLLCLSAMTIGLLTDNLGFVFELNGAINASILAFILPGLLTLQMDGGINFKITRARAPAMAVTTFGIVLLIFGTSFAIYDAVENEDLGYCDS